VVDVKLVASHVLAAPRTLVPAATHMVFIAQLVSEPLRKAALAKVLVGHVFRCTVEGRGGGRELQESHHHFDVHRNNLMVFAIVHPVVVGARSRGVAK